MLQCQEEHRSIEHLRLPLASRRTFGGDRGRRISKWWARLISVSGLRDVEVVSRWENLKVCGPETLIPGC